MFEVNEIAEPVAFSVFRGPKPDAVRKWAGVANGTSDSSRMNLSNYYRQITDHIRPTNGMALAITNGDGR